jgi:hypothetical protein
MITTAMGGSLREAKWDRILLLLQLLAILVVASACPTAWANGAFPNSLGILLPADRPAEIVLATTFGLISSEDGGKTWTWSCEQPVAASANQYQIGAPPLDRIFALSSHGLIHSDDGSCTWSTAGGSLQDLWVTDAFADPTDPMHILAIGLPNSMDLTLESVYASTDGGVTFGAPLLTVPAMGVFTGIEVARSDPTIVYVAMYETPNPRPKLVKSADGGKTWDAPLDLEPVLGASTLRILAVDPTDPGKIFLRVSQALGDVMAVSADGGLTFQTPVKFAFQLTAFDRLASGTILVAGFDFDPQGNPIAASYRSTDGGHTFDSWPAPRLRALAERGGQLYGAADNFKDGFALGVSTDEGLTFTPLMTYDKVTSVMACVQTVCADSCLAQAALPLWSASICPASTPGADAGAQPDGALPANAAAGGRAPHSRQGCACAGSTTSDFSATVFAAALAGALQERRRRRRRGTRELIVVSCARISGHGCDASPDWTRRRVTAGGDVGIARRVRWRSLRDADSAERQRRRRQRR